MTKQLNAVNGQLDLRGYDFSKNPSVELSGDWEIYWKQFVPPENFRHGESSSGSFSLINVPSPWGTRSLDGSRHVFGFSTYHLRLLVNSAKFHSLSFMCKEQNSAYSLWANGKAVISAGKPDTNTAGEIASFHIANTEIPIMSDTIDLVMHLSNYHIDNGGFANPLIIGSKDKLNQAFTLSFMLQMTSLGLMLIFFLQFGAAWIRRPQDRSFLYLALYALCWSVAVFMESAELRPVSILFPSFPFELLNKIYFSAMVGSLPFSCLFCAVIFPSRIFAWTNKILITITLCFVLLILTTSTATFTVAFPYFITIVDLFIATIVYAVAKAIRKKRSGAVIYAMGFALFCLAGLNDSLYNSAIIHTRFICTYGAVSLLLAAAIVVSRNYADTFTANEKLLSDLHSKTDELETLMACGTANAGNVKNMDKIESYVTEMKDLLSHEHGDLYTLGADIMKQVVSLWESATGASKADFAKESGLWSVMADRNGWRRTATLDKYLDISKIPRNPKWNLVFESAEFVLRHKIVAPMHKPEIDILKKKIVRLRSIV